MVKTYEMVVRIEAFQLTKQMILNCIFENKEIPGINISSCEFHRSRNELYSYTCEIRDTTYRPVIGDYIIKDSAGKYSCLSKNMFEMLYKEVK